VAQIVDILPKVW